MMVIICLFNWAVEKKERDEEDTRESQCLYYNTDSNRERKMCVMTE